MRLRIAVLAPPHISNLDEFLPLARVPGVQLQWVRRPAQLAGADWVVLPGSKQVSGDLAWLRGTGLAEAVQHHARAGGAVLGVCGGLQMLGHTLYDPDGHDGVPFQALPGLGLLPLSTAFGASKRLLADAVAFAAPHGVWGALAGVRAQGYEIRCGQTLVDVAGANHAVLLDAAGQAIGWQQGSVLGVYAHGLFEQPAVLRALFGALAPTLDQAFELLADTVEQHLDPALLRRLLGH